ncbi:MAG: hypothetical protein V3S21_08405, partial [Xanthomonadales bacterium]
SGMLLEPFSGQRVFNHGDWYLACLSDKTDREEISIFRDWLLQEVHKDKAMSQSRQSPHATIKELSL